MGSAKKFNISSKANDTKSFKLFIKEAARVDAWGLAVSNALVVWEEGLLSKSPNVLTDFAKNWYGKL